MPTVKAAHFNDEKTLFSAGRRRSLVGAAPVSAGRRRRVALPFLPSAPSRSARSPGLVPGRSLFLRPFPPARPSVRCPSCPPSGPLRASLVSPGSGAPCRTRTCHRPLRMLGYTNTIRSVPREPGTVHGATPRTRQMMARWYSIAAVRDHAVASRSRSPAAGRHCSATPIASARDTGSGPLTTSPLVPFRRS